MKYKEETGAMRSALDHKALGPWKEHTRFTNLTGTSSRHAGIRRAPQTPNLFPILMLTLLLP